MPRQNEDLTLEYARRMARILYAIEYLGRYCKICHFDGFIAPWLIDFHHRDDTTKKYEVKNKLYHGGFNSHKEEIEKCDLVCVSCHRMHHINIEKYNINKDLIFKKLEELKTNNTGKITKNHFINKEEMNKIFEMVDNGFSIKKISEQLKINYSTLSSFIRRHKLDPKKKFKISWSIVAKMLNAKHSLRSIAEKLNINREILRSNIENNIQCETFDNGVKRYKRKNN